MEEKTIFDKDRLNLNYKSQIDAAKEAETAKRETEFVRYKQDCRKRALDLAHSQLSSPTFKKYLEDNEFVKTDKTKEENPVVSHKLLLEMADQYYDWLIFIPDNETNTN